MSFRLQDFRKKQKDSSSKTPKKESSQKATKTSINKNNLPNSAKPRKKSNKTSEQISTDKQSEMDLEGIKNTNLPCIIEENSIEANRKDSEEVAKQILIGNNFNKNIRSRRGSKEVLSSTLKVCKYSRGQIKYSSKRIDNQVLRSGFRSENYYIPKFLTSQSTSRRKSRSFSKKC